MPAQDQPYVDRRRPGAANSIRRMFWPWSRAHAITNMLYGAIVGTALSIMTVLVYIHGLR